MKTQQFYFSSIINFNTSKYTIKENTVSVECFRLDTVYWVLVSKALFCLSELTQCLPDLVICMCVAFISSG